MEQERLLPKKVYARTRKNSEGKIEVVFTKHLPVHIRGDQFFSYGMYELRELFVVGSGFKLTFKEQGDYELEGELPKVKKL